MTATMRMRLYGRGDGTLQTEKYSGVPVIYDRTAERHKKIR
jgi:hypothetical protein